MFMTKRKNAKNEPFNIAAKSFSVLTINIPKIKKKFDSIILIVFTSKYSYFKYVNIPITKVINENRKRIRINSFFFLLYIFRKKYSDIIIKIIAYNISEEKIFCSKFVFI